LLKNKKGVFERLSDAGFRVRKKSESERVLSHDSLLGSCPVIDADFVEVGDDFSMDKDSSFKPDSEPIDSELLEKLREYLKTRSQEEISEIFEEIHKILESRASESKFNNNQRKEIPDKEKVKIKETLKSAFRICSETASFGKKQIINASKSASLKASSIASERKESLKVSSKKLNDKWSNLSPGDRKIISELIITVIEIGLLKNSSRGKQATFAILSSISRRQTPGRKDLEEFVEGLRGLIRRRH
jgi:predicted house-cleaning noncanonical NTP pyrophosphatase (MazG superfamily)